jgi:hypothetical protein
MTTSRPSGAIGVLPVLIASVAAAVVVQSQQEAVSLGADSTTDLPFDRRLLRWWSMVPPGDLGVGFQGGQHRPGDDYRAPLTRLEITCSESERAVEVRVQRPDALGELVVLMMSDLSIDEVLPGCCQMGNE